MRSLRGGGPGNTNEWMSKHYDRLMKYGNEGETFIVQYNNPQFREDSRASVLIRSRLPTGG